MPERRTLCAWRARRAGRSGGFTLIELLVVLGLLALLAAVVPPLLAGRGHSELATAARETAAALRETRSAAIAAGRAETFAPDLARGGFPAGGETRHWPGGVQASLIGGITAPPIRFFPDGSSSGGGLVLRRGRWRYEVAVDWLTGRVSVAEIEAPR